MVTLAKHRFNVQDYYRMAEAGVLKPDARVELLEGEIIDMSPIGPFHGGVTTYLNELFVAASCGRWRTAIQTPIHLDDYSSPHPDLALLRATPDFYRQRHPRPDEVYLLVEVADTSLATAREGKLPAYGRAGIGEVWIVNLNDLVVEVYREPQFKGYASKTVLRPGEVAHPQAFPDVAVDLGELLKR